MPRVILVIAATIAAIAAVVVIVGCTPEPDTESYGVCIDPVTQLRVDDDYCDDDPDGLHHAWVFYALHQVIAPVGSPLYGYSTTRPRGRITMNMPRAGIAGRQPTPTAAPNPAPVRATTPATAPTAAPSTAAPSRATQAPATQPRVTQAPRTQAPAQPRTAPRPAPAPPRPAPPRINTRPGR